MPTVCVKRSRNFAASSSPALPPSKIDLVRINSSKVEVSILMSSPLRFTVLNVRHVYALFVAIFVLAVAVCVKAQAPGSRGLSSGEGSHAIQGRIHFPAGQPVNSKVVKINLETNSSVGGMSTMSDEDGTFRFNGLPPGSYALVVDAGKQYETAREPVTIEQSGAAPVLQVNIQLR